MPPLPVQVRLEPHHLTALDAARVVTDPASGLAVTLSRQQVLLGILDQWIAAQDREAQAVTETVTDPAHVRRMIQEEMRAVIAHAEHIIDAIDTAQPVTDTVTDTQSQPDEAAAVEPEPELPRQSDDQSDDYEDRPRARRVAIPQDDEVENMPLVQTDVATTVKTARPKAAAKPKAKAARQRAVTDTVTDTEAPQSPASNAQRRKRLPVAY